MTHVRLGIIGIGNMGANHGRAIAEGKVARCTLSAVCDPDPNRFSQFPGAAPFTQTSELLTSGLVDAVLICTPHYSHTDLGIAGLESGLHVLVEKPISAHKADCERLIAAHQDERQVFAAMFNQRTDPRYVALKSLLDEGSLGPVRRIQWTITNWFRTQAYYDSGGWRATWAGEGGGVLLNQSPHQLDLWQWLFGMPAAVRAFCHVGRYHSIEVEDDVTAYLQYPGGTTGTFITSTGEAPGTNRLEIAGDLARAVLEKDTLQIIRNEVSMKEYCETNPGRFTAPATVEETMTIEGGSGPQHVGIIQNFVDAILDGAPLIAPAREGIHSVELANAMLQSSFEDRTISLPMDSAAYAKLLQARIAASTFVKTTPGHRKITDDFAGSFSR